MKKLKYLVAFFLPISVYIAYTNKGLWTILPIFLMFFLLPLLELIFKPDHTNYPKDVLDSIENDPFYDIVLLLTFPFQIVAVIWFFYAIQEPNLTTLEYVGRIFALGTMCGIFGINVGHELGHRTSNRMMQFVGELMLMTSLETHFLPYHNSGHHFNVGTPKDPATARKNEPLYLFWIRSQIGSYIQAWQLEAKRMQIIKKSFFSIHNKMIVYTVAQVAMLLLIYYFFGSAVLIPFVIAAVIGILLLETVNYIEHYGLVRKLKPNGKYERILPKHSWNSNHIIGRLFMFELSRHSDHHHRTHKHFQVLESIDESPQMPAGYSAMMFVAFFPPIWFKIMNKRILQFEERIN